jgi:glycosyltransferase involved in cell wall biosynthesis
MSSRIQRINFITNFAAADATGGWNGISAQLFEGLSKYFEVSYVGPVNPLPDYPAKLLSKLRRLCGLPGNFQFFSQRRLRNIAAELHRRTDDAASYDFFHGQTPWIAYESPRPYAVYMDACFSTYLDVYHQRSDFCGRDVQRICRREAAWLSGAANVFAGSRWAIGSTVRSYSISSANFHPVWVGGCADVPETCSSPSGRNFVFIGLDFLRKGGRLCADAFRIVQHKHPEATLTFVGERPPPDVLSLPGVRYAGFLRKTVAEERKRFEEILSKAFALIHPTTMDTMGMVLIEAGYYGCPAITTNDFGIPELVKDGVSGFLIDPPLTSSAFGAKMLQLCKDQTMYLKMREAARAITTTKLTWEAVTQRIVEHIERT